MASDYQAIVWIDHREAKVFHFNATEVDRMILHPHNPTRHIRREANAIGSGDAPLDHEFFEQVTDAIAEATAVLITGPSSAKSDLATHVARHYPNIARCVVGVETIDHPSDGALIAVARLHFRAEDRSRPRI